MGTDAAILAPFAQSLIAAVKGFMANNGNSAANAIDQIGAAVPLVSDLPSELPRVPLSGGPQEAQEMFPPLVIERAQQRVMQEIKTLVAQQQTIRNIEARIKIMLAQEPSSLQVKQWAAKLLAELENMRSQIDVQIDKLVRFNLFLEDWKLWVMDQLFKYT